MRRSPAYIETPQIRLPPAVNLSHQNIRGVHSEHTQNFIYPSLKCKWPIHTKLLAPNDLISLSYRTQYCVWNDNVYYELKKKNRLKYLSATWPVLEDFLGLLKVSLSRHNNVNFQSNPHERHPIACQWGRDQGCLLWIQLLRHISPQSLPYHMQNHAMMVCAKMAVMICADIGLVPSGNKQCLKSGACESSMLFWSLKVFFLHVFSQKISIYLIHAKTKWSPFGRQHFQFHLLVWEVFDINFTEIVSMCTINSKLWLVEIIAWHQTGNKPLSEPIMALFTDGYIIYVSWHQWVNSVLFCMSIHGICMLYRCHKQTFQWAFLSCIQDIIKTKSCYLYMALLMGLCKKM